MDSKKGTWQLQLLGPTAHTWKVLQGFGAGAREALGGLFARETAWRGNKKLVFGGDRKRSPVPGVPVSNSGGVTAVLRVQRVNREGFLLPCAQYL